jgi:ribose transport system substrate-binding protein
MLDSYHAKSIAYRSRLDKKIAHLREGAVLKSCGDQGIGGFPWSADDRRNWIKGGKSYMNSNGSTTRRDVLRYGALAAGALGLTGISVSATEANKKFNIALSNAYIGNEWRKQMAEACERAAKEMQERGLVGDYSAVHGSDNSVPAQLAAVNDMILKKYDGILLNCSSGSQVGGVIDQASDAGIKVVSFDAYATSNRSWNIGFDFASWGKNNADFMEQHLGGSGKAKGNILIVRLALGAVAGNLIYDEYKKMLARNPDLKVVGEVEGQATRSVAQRNVAQILPGLPKIDGVLGAGGNDSFGIVEGFLASGYTAENMPPICTGADGDYINWWREARDKHGYKATGMNATPEIGAWAVYYLTQVLESGDTEPKNFTAPSVLTNNENLDSFGDVKGERIPVTQYKFEEIPGIFTKVDKLQG